VAINDPPPPPDYDHKAIVDAMDEGERWFVAQIEQRTLNARFKKYLDLNF
jgi:hypothetical protein